MATFSQRIKRALGVAFGSKAVADQFELDVKSVTAAEIDDASVATAKLADEAVTVDKMADLTRGSILVGTTAGNRPNPVVALTANRLMIGDGNDFLAQAIGGDVALAAGAVTIQPLAVTLAKMANLDRGHIIVGDNANRPSSLTCHGAGNILVGTGLDLASVPMSVDAAIAVGGAVTIQPLAVTLGKMANLAQGRILIGDAWNRPDPLDCSTVNQILIGQGATAAMMPMAGDCTIVAAGTVTIGAGAVDIGKLANAAKVQTVTVHVPAFTILPVDNVPNLDQNAPVGFIAPANVTLISAYVQCDTVIAAGDADNHYELNLYNGAADTLAANVSLVAGVAQYAATLLTVDQNADIAAGAQVVLRVDHLDAAGGAAVTNLSAATWKVTVNYRLR